MPRPRDRHRHQVATLWQSTGVPDRYGEYQYEEHVELDVRWESGRKQAADPKGNLIAVDATVHVDRVIRIGSKMVQGTYEHWLGVGSAGNDAEVMEVVTYTEVPDLKGRLAYYEVGLAFQSKRA